MKKLVISEQAIFYGECKMPEGFEINSFKLCEQIFQYIYFKDAFTFSTEWEKLNNYIKEFYQVKHKKNLINKESEGLIFYPNQTSQPISDVDPVNLRESPDFTMLYGVHTKDCFVKIYYDDNRSKGRDWTIPLKKNRYIIFPSSNKYIVLNYQKQLLNFIQKITYEGL